MATITQSNSDNFLTWQKVNGVLTLADLQANGVISGIASATMDDEVEWTKGANSVQKKTLIITNTGTIPLTLTAAFSGSDNTYFNFDNGASFNIAVGASHNLIMSVDLASSGIYITTLNITDTRASIGLIGTAKLAHISIDAALKVRGDIPTDATVLSVIGSGSIVFNQLGAENIPTSDSAITTVLSPLTIKTWLLNISGIAPSFTGARRFRDTANVYRTFGYSGVSNINGVVPGFLGDADYFGLAEAGWNGVTDLFFEII